MMRHLTLNPKHTPQSDYSLKTLSPSSSTYCTHVRIEGRITLLFLILDYNNLMEPVPSSGGGGGGGGGLPSSSVSALMALSHYSVSY